MLEGIDKHISVLTESLARALSRRKVIEAGVKGVFATIAAGALGQLVDIKQAFAGCTCECDDCWTQGNPCNDFGHNCPTGAQGGCPSGCSICTSSDYCGGFCGYPSGYWVSCSGLCACHGGYRLCTDCKCPNCSVTCTCLSGIFCCNCCTRQDVEAEMRRVAALYASYV